MEGVRKGMKGRDERGRGGKKGGLEGLFGRCCFVAYGVLR